MEAYTLDKNGGLEPVYLALDEVETTEQLRNRLNISGDVLVRFGDKARGHQLSIARCDDPWSTGYEFVAEHVLGSGTDAEISFIRIKDYPCLMQFLSTTVPAIEASVARKKRRKGDAIRNDES